MRRNRQSPLFRATAAAAAGAVALALLGAGQAQPDSDASPESGASMDGFAADAVSADGTIRVPEAFRTEFVLLGAWSVVGDADTDGAVGLHVVYAPRDAVAAYRRTGAFPDGTVLVKELFATETESLTTGAASRASEKAGTFVMVKDAKGRFPGDPLWGDGWGWAFFEAGETRATVSTDYQGDCLGCHEPARATDLVYVQGYPVLN